MSHGYERIVILWVVVALVAWLAGRIPALDPMFVNVGRAIALVVLVIWTFHALGLL